MRPRSGRPGGAIAVLAVLAARAKVRIGVSASEGAFYPIQICWGRWERRERPPEEEEEEEEEERPPERPPAGEAPRPLPQSHGFLVGAPCPWRRWRRRARHDRWRRFVNKFGTLVLFQEGCWRSCLRVVTLLHYSKAFSRIECVFTDGNNVVGVFTYVKRLHGLMLTSPSP